jgi:hypothetical protein
VFNVLGSINWIAILVAFVAYFLEATGRRAAVARQSPRGGAHPRANSRGLIVECVEVIFGGMSRAGQRS